MRIPYAVVLAIALASLATACGRAEAPTVASSTGVAAASPEAVITPPVTKAPEVPLPPLPSNITASPNASGPDPTPAEQPTGSRDTAGNDPKGDLTSAQESNEMPKANQANNHSSTSLDQSPSN